MPQRTKPITINIDHRALEHLDQHVRAHQPLLSRHRAAWVALNLGLEVLDAKPELLLQSLERDMKAIMKSDAGLPALQALALSARQA